MQIEELSKGIMNEKPVEKNIVKQTRKAGGEAYKWVSPGHNDVPDRILLFPIPKVFRALIARYIRFVEAKAPGKKLRTGQDIEKKYLESLGFKVEVVDDPKWKLEK